LQLILESTKEKKLFCFGVPKIRNGGKAEMIFRFFLFLYFGRQRPARPTLAAAWNSPDNC